MASNLLLTSPIEQIPTMTDIKANILKKAFNIVTINDVITHYPYRYIDKSKVYSVREISPQSQYIQLYGKISVLKLVGEGSKKRLTATFTDSTGTIELVWFQSVQWYQKNIDTQSQYLIFGKPQKFGSRYSIVHPEARKAFPADIESLTGFQAVYPTTEAMKKKGLDSAGLSKYIKLAMMHLESTELFEFLPIDIAKKYSLISYPAAIKYIHFPTENQQIETAQKRLKFNEFFLIQLQLKKSQNIRLTAQKGYFFEKLGDNFNTFYAKFLPFELTSAQKRVLKEIRSDTLSNIQMNRLLQGDVGSGKTVVALISMLIAVDNGFQACMMAPTEILARQHLESLTELLQEMPIEVEILTGSTTAKQKAIILDKLLHGKIDILLGTHALIEPTVVFKNLGLVIIDEQHRFGVQQRGELWKKNDKPPHILVMTATPIPRTLAMTLYGDLDYSVIDELPPGRKAIQTKHIFYKDKSKCYEFIKKEIAQGRQIYIVYPLIEESKNIDLKNLLDGYEELKLIFSNAKYTLTMVHGKMKNKEKNENMALFVEGKAQILVSTTVIEVGVNVPNASIMLIQNADRFGLSQLHQLRGRVGRGAEQSYCILMTEYNLSMDARKRVNIMVESSDGFYIAEEDLKLRGPGDIAGTKQSGDIQLKIASISKDATILDMASKVALEILHEDNQLITDKYKYLRYFLQKTMRELDIWSKIS